MNLIRIVVGAVVVGREPQTQRVSLGAGGRRAVGAVRALALMVVLAGATPSHAQVVGLSGIEVAVQVLGGASSMVGGGHLAAFGSVRAVQGRRGAGWFAANLGAAAINVLLGCAWLASDRGYGYQRGPQPGTILLSTAQFAVGTANLVAAVLNLVLQSRPEAPETREPPAIVPVVLQGRTAGGRWTGLGVEVAL